MEEVQKKEHMRKPEPIAIYGWFDKRGRCRYIGQSVEPWSRREDHLKPACKNRHLFRSCEFRLLRWASGIDHANRLEVQIIKSLQRRGLADRNKSTRPSCGPSAVNYIYSESLGAFFDSFAACARHFKTSPRDVRDRAIAGVDGLRVLWWHEVEAGNTLIGSLRAAQANPERMHAHKPWLYDQWKDNPAAIALGGYPKGRPRKNFEKGKK
jgi:hypothetical protein